MSNVLIGIIGVILFIGLALAGALFLGPKFQSASNDSKAAAVMQGLQQTVNAYEMRRLNEGAVISADKGNDVTQMLIDGGYLKSSFRNPLNRSIGIIAVDDGGTQSASKPIASIVMTLEAGSNTTARDVCRLIEKRAGVADENAFDIRVMFDVKLAKDRRLGCFHNAYSDEYAVYAAL
jgi:hypothetical protein